MSIKLEDEKIVLQELAAPQVTVVCITYKHEDYIRQALDSFLAQKTNFPFQIFVGEDCGPDHTADIIREYAEKYPDKVIPFLREKNMGAQRNLVDMCQQAKSPYIAFCEGDDYWIDDCKLQKQYDFMQEHPEYRACFHNTQIVAPEDWYLNSFYQKDAQGRSLIPYSIPGYDKKKREMRMDYYIRFGPAHTSSMFFRWNFDLEIPEWYYTHIFGDHPMMMMQVGDGLLGFIPDVMSVYRRSEVGVIMHENIVDHFLATRQSWINMATDLERYFAEHYGDFCGAAIRSRIVIEITNYIRYLLENGDEDGARKAFEEYPYQSMLALKSYLQIRNQYVALQRIYTPTGITGLKRYKKDVKTLLSKMGKEDKTKLHKRKEVRLKNYQSYAKYPKDPALWLFMGSKIDEFSGNVRHLYEYVIAFHPEIKAVWLTKNKDVLKLFEAENLPGCKLATKNSRVLLKQASVLVTDSFRSDIFKMRGFNANTKVVRLLDDNCWDNVLSDTFQAPELPESWENSTEEYRDAFMAVVPSTELARKYSQWYQIPEERFFVAGQPRMFAVADRTSADHQKRVLIFLSASTRLHCLSMADSFWQNIEQWQAFAEEQNIGIDIVCRGGHYSVLTKRLKSLSVSEEVLRVCTIQDMGSQLPNYDVVVADSLGILYDFLIQDRPCIYFHEEDAKADAVPGIQVKTWPDCQKALESCLMNKQTEQQLRDTVKTKVFDSCAFNTQSPENIVLEIQRRLKENQ